MSKKVKIIAEAGINHNGNYKKVFDLVDIAKNSNADFVKFQLFNTDYFINKKFKHKQINFEKIYNRFKKLEFTFQQWKKVCKYCKKIGIEILFSVFDHKSLELIKKLKIKIVKIPSGEINNYDLLKSVNKSRFKTILSTGMSNLEEVKKASKCLKNCEVTLLHCVSEYPTNAPNLKNINLLKKKFNKSIGFSDHTADTITPALSVIAGAKLIEKHFTYNKNQKVGDHKFSLSPKELKVMIQNVKLAEASMGLNKRLISKKEKNLQFFARKGLYFKRDMYKGKRILSSDLIALRPQGNLSIDKIDLIKKKKLKKNVKILDPIKFGLLMN